MSSGANVKVQVSAVDALGVESALSNELVFRTVASVNVGGGSTRPIGNLGAPTSSQKTGSVVAGSVVELMGPDDADIYYTTDGSTPTVNSEKYTAPIVITEDMTIKAISVKGNVVSSVTTYEYVIRGAKISWKKDASATRYLAVTSDFARPDDAITRYEMIDALNLLLDLELVPTDKNLTDVDLSHKAVVELFIGVGIIDGFPDGTFKGDNGLTRAEFVKIISIITGVEASDEKSEYSDTDGHWAEGFITEFTKLGYLKGYEDGSFRPDAEMTRAEFTAIVNRIVPIRTTFTPHSFKDIDVNHWANSDIQNAYLLK